MADAPAPRRPRATLRDTLPRLASGTELRDGLERILRGRTGALIVLGCDELVNSLCDGGFHIDTPFSPTRLRELSKMDGGVVLTCDGTRITRANVQFVPDHRISTEESGTRHRAAERMSIHTGFPVISVSSSMSIATVYVEGKRHVLEDSATILSRANQAVATMDRYKERLDAVAATLTRAEIEDFVTLRDALTVVQRLEMVRRVAHEIDGYVSELGTDGQQLAVQLAELYGDNDIQRSLMLRDYVACTGHPSSELLATTMKALEELSDTELLDLSELARIFEHQSSVEALDQPVTPRGYRMLSQIPRVPYLVVDRIVHRFGELQPLLAASAVDLEGVDGVSGECARHIREGLSRVAESSLAERL